MLLRLRPVDDRKAPLAGLNVIPLDSLNHPAGEGRRNLLCAFEAPSAQRSFYSQQSGQRLFGQSYPFL